MNWFRVRASADPAVAEFLIYDFIGDWGDAFSGDGVTAQAFVQTLEQLAAEVRTVRVRVNSPGGNPFAGVAIANALRAQREEHGRTVEMQVDGLAASAASLVLMAGNIIRIADNALMMIHDPSMLVYGDAGELRKSAETLDTIRQTLIATYRWQSPLSEAAIGDMLQAETWMTADEAIANGFAHEKIEGLIPADVDDQDDNTERAAAALFSARAVNRLRVPDTFKDRIAAFARPALTRRPPAPQPGAPAAAAVEVLRLCRESGCSDLAEGFVTSGASLDVIQARLKTEAQARGAEKDRVAQITALCTRVGLPMLSAAYVAGGMKVDAVKAQLVEMLAIADGRIQVDTSLNPSGPMVPRYDVFEEYAALNGISKRQ